MSGEHKIERGKIVLNGQLIHDGKSLNYDASTFENMRRKNHVTEATEEVTLRNFACSSIEVL